MSENCCFFIGHREAPAELVPTLRAAIEQNITKYGVTEFLVGSYGGFDRLAARCVIEAKRAHPGILLTLLLPYYPSRWKTVLLPGFDGSCYPPGQESVPPQAAIIRANRYAVDHSACLIAYVWHAASNAHNLLTYARKHPALRITCLPQPLCPREPDSKISP